MGLDLGGRAHPRQAVDGLRVGLHQVVHQLHHARLVRGREMLGHVELADGLAHRGVDGAHGTFPARAVGLDAAHRDAVELEARLAHVGRQLQRDGVDQVRAQVGLPHVQRLGPDQPGHRLGVARLADGDERRIRQLAGGEEALPVGAGRLGRDLRDRQRVVALDRIAQLFGLPLGLGQLGLEAHHRGGLDLRVPAALRGQHLADVLDVGRAGLRESRVLVQVVVALAQAEAALAGGGRVHGRILRVGAHAQAHRQVDERRPLAHQAHQVGPGLDGVDLRQVRPQRTHAGGVDGRGVHVAVVEVGDLGAGAAGRLRLAGQAFDDRLDARVGQVVEHRERAVVGLVGGQLHVLHPGAVHRAEQAVLRPHAGVHAGLVDARGQRRLGGGGRRDGERRRAERQVGREGQGQGDDQGRGTEEMHHEFPRWWWARRAGAAAVFFERDSRATRGATGLPGPSTCGRPAWCRTPRGSHRC